MTTRAQALALAGMIESAAKEREVSRFMMPDWCGCIAGIVGMNALQPDDPGEDAGLVFMEGIHKINKILGGDTDLLTYDNYRASLVRRTTATKEWPVVPYNADGTWKSICAASGEAFYDREVRLVVPVKRVLHVLHTWAGRLPDTETSTSSTSTQEQKK